MHLLLSVVNRPEKKRPSIVQSLWHGSQLNLSLLFGCQHFTDSPRQRLVSTLLPFFFCDLVFLYFLHTLGEFAYSRELIKKFPMLPIKRQKSFWLCLSLMFCFFGSLLQWNTRPNAVYVKSTLSLGLGMWLFFKITIPCFFLLFILKAFLSALKIYPLEMFFICCRFRCLKCFNYDLCQVPSIECEVYCFASC